MGRKANFIKSKRPTKRQERTLRDKKEIENVTKHIFKAKLKRKNKHFKNLDDIPSLAQSAKKSKNKFKPKPKESAKDESTCSDEIPLLVDAPSSDFEQKDKSSKPKDKTYQKGNSKKTTKVFNPDNTNKEDNESLKSDDDDDLEMEDDFLGSQDDDEIDEFDDDDDIDDVEEEEEDEKNEHVSPKKGKLDAKKNLDKNDKDMKIKKKNIFDLADEDLDDDDEEEQAAAKALEEESSDEDDVEDAQMNRLLKINQEDYEESSEDEVKKAKDEPEQEGDENEEDLEPIKIFPDEDEEDKKKKVMVPDLEAVYERIKAIVEILANFKKRREEGRSRSEYMDRLIKDCCTYFSYNEFLMEKLSELFSPGELLEFLEANEMQRPLTIRVNTLKTRRKELAQTLINRGVNLDPLESCPIGLVVYNSQVPIGATPEYQAGHYILQGGASWFAVMALAPQRDERILDLCAAPGAKTTHIGQEMKNTGVLVANEIHKERAKAITSNCHRLGITNVAVVVENGRKYPQALSLHFDRVLLDAPCSGTGIISKDPSVKAKKDYKEIMQCAHVQKQLILSAIDSLKVNGVLVYSTCSILVEENEEVIQYALKKRKVKIVPTGLEHGQNGFQKFRKDRFDPNMSKTKRFYPHAHNVDGFFVAKLVKLEAHKPKVDSAAAANGDMQEENPEEDGTKGTKRTHSPEKSKKKAKVSQKEEKEEEEEQDSEDLPASPQKKDPSPAKIKKKTFKNKKHSNPSPSQTKKQLSAKKRIAKHHGSSKKVKQGV